MKSFNGVAVYPRKVSADQGNMVGIWLERQISAQERRDILALEKDYKPGHIGVDVNSRRTIVRFIGRFKDSRTGRHIAVSLSRAVSAITGTTSVLEQLPSCRAIGRALAVD